MRGTTFQRLHPHMADVFRQKTEQLAAALESDTERDAARLALRGFLEKIVIPPGDGLLQVVGNLGEMLTAVTGRDGTASAAVGYVGCGGGQPGVLAAVERGGVRAATERVGGQSARNQADFTQSLRTLPPSAPQPIFPHASLT